MTDDIAQGLALLADEADPAPIDSHAVIARARARTRNRRTTAAAFLAVVAIGGLAVTSNADRPSNEVAEQPELPSQRLTAQLTAALPDVIPAGWEAKPAPPYDGTTRYPEPLVFACSLEAPPQPIEFPDSRPTMGPSGPPSDSCSAMGYYQDAEGALLVYLTVKDIKTWPFDSCVGAPDCDEWTLSDGTRVLTDADTAGVASPGHLQQIHALRPDNTQIELAVTWQDGRTSPPLTLEELVKWATAFDY
ncbi:hypothetical protein [Actinophytocola sp.]|uniref:hypothetical protein n=1 Tax=Actinophytocola sp. TaxID=1872138 RepID=UPI002ED56267